MHQEPCLVGFQGGEEAMEEDEDEWPGGGRLPDWIPVIDYTWPDPTERRDDGYEGLRF